MLNLYKNEMFVLIKSKLALINTLIFLGINVLIVLVYFLINTLVPEFNFNGDNIYLSAFTITNNGIYALEVMVLLFVVRDFNNGTFRNKVLASYSRTKIYFAKLLAILSVTLAMFVLTVVAVSLLALAFFGFSNLFTVDFFIKVTGIGLLNILFVVFLVFFLGITMKHFPSGLAVIIGIGFIFSILSSSIIALISTGLIDANSWINVVLKFLPWYQNLWLIQTVNTPEIPGFISNLTLSEFDINLFVTTNIVYITLLLYFGWLAFKKTDLK